MRTVLYAFRCLRQIIHTLVLHWRLVGGLIFLMLAEIYLHARSFTVTRPSTNLDPPFHTGCQEPILNTTSRANATIVMLARNSDVDGAVASVNSVQKQFNGNFGYPWVFLNDKEWTEEFVEKVSSAVTAWSNDTEVHFETIPGDMWGYPDWIDLATARKKMDDMESQGIIYAGTESYHHMCRFQSG